MNDEIKQCFQVLELDATASAKEIKQARNEMAKVWHPDRFPNDPKLQKRGQEKLKEINAAYARLTDYFSNPSNWEPKRQPKTSQPDTRTRPSPPPTSTPDSKQSSQVKQLELTVKNDIERHFAQNPVTRSTQVLTFNLNPAIGNQYKGLLITQTNGKTEAVWVNVWDDGQKIKWDRERLSIELTKPPLSQESESDSEETILYAPCDCCGRQLDFPESKTGDKIQCPICGNETFLPYGASVRRKAKPQSQKPFEERNGAQVNNSQSNNHSSPDTNPQNSSEGNSQITIILGVIGFICIAFGVIDFAGVFFHYDITGVSWSPMVASLVGWFFFGLAKGAKK